MNTVRILQLYPEELNLYGDRGNTRCLLHRLHERGIPTEYRGIGVGECIPDFDIMLIGGGQDKEMRILSLDLRRKSEMLRFAVETGKVIFGVCGGYQLLGESYITAKGDILRLSAALPFTTEAGAERHIGNLVFDSPFGNIVGFENHAGITRLHGLPPLGRVITGYGNDGGSGEGVLYKNTFGTYAHGPVLPKNPALADELIRRALGCATLPPLDDTLENRCHDALLAKFA